ncbi:MAG: glycosyltransferase [Deltaproteobacteria bacterium]
MAGKSVVLLVSNEYPPYSSWGGNAYQMFHLAKLLNRAGYEVEIIAESHNGEEFSHLDAQGNLVHRISAERSYVTKMLRLAAPLFKRLDYLDFRFASRVAEKAYELTQLWGRRLLWVETTSWRAQTLLLHLLPDLNRRIFVRNVTPMAEVVLSNQMPRADPEVRASLWHETITQLLLRHRLYSNEDYRPYYERLVRPFRAGWGRAVERVPKVARRSHAGKVQRLLMVGRLEPRKGFDAVCSALSGLTVEARRSIRIVAVGRDTDFGPLKSYRALLAERFPEVVADCFDFRGGVSDAQLQKLMGEVDGGLVASTSESFGYNLLELVAAGLPVITSDVGAASEFERRGVGYVGKFRTALELRHIFEELPDRLARHRARGLDNRATLERVYRDNDREYLEFARSRSLHVADLPPRGPRPAPVDSAEVVICSYERFEELTVSLTSVLREVSAAEDAGIRCKATVVYQNEGLPDRIYDWRPDLRGDARLRFVFSSPPSLTRARNVGVAATTGELIIFVDDDVVLDRGFVVAHVKAANAHPTAVGTAGRIRSRLDDEKVTGRCDVGQIRLTGHIETNFDSQEQTATLVPQTPMGANMAYRRSAMNELFGDRWFDESLVGSAFREESTLGIRIVRLGRHLVYAPDAALLHFESVVGGCNNRTARRTLRQRVRHYGLDHLFLARLFEGEGLLWLSAVLQHVRRDLGYAESPRAWLARLAIEVGGIARGRWMHRTPPQAPTRPSLPRVAHPADESAGGETTMARVS